MSETTELGREFGYLPELLEKYEEELENAKAVIKVEGKLLEKANLEQASWQLYYDEKRAELSKVLKQIEMKKEQIRGQLYKSYTENYSRELTQRDKEQYINNETQYLSIQEIYLEVQEMYEKFVALMDAFKSRGFALRNVTDLRVHSLENTQY